MKIRAIILAATLGLLAGLHVQAEPTPPDSANRDSKTEVPFIGIATTSPMPVLTSQLKLQPGFGLVVTMLVDDKCPAAQAGIQVNDVLTQFDDQQLVNMEQLVTLVKSHKPGDEIALTLIRGGEKQTVKVKIGTHLEDSSETNGVTTVNSILPMLKIFTSKSGAISISGSSSISGAGMPGAGILISGFAQSVSSDQNGKHYEFQNSDGKEVLTITGKDGKQEFTGDVSNPEQIEKLPKEDQQALKTLKEQLKQVSTKVMHGISTP